MFDPQTCPECFADTVWDVAGVEVEISCEECG